MGSGWCSHFGTACTKTKKNNKVVIALRLSTATSTSKPKVTTAPKRTWREVGSKQICDVSAGETYPSNSPGKVSNLEECKKSCGDASGCQSITYFKSGWCSHFGTACAKTKKNNKVVIALRLSTATSTSKPGVTT